jgi:hypothetical protein
MNGKRAREIRALVYGDYSPKVREYKQLPNGQIIADRKRNSYQYTKKHARLFL